MKLRSAIGFALLTLSLFSSSTASADPVPGVSFSASTTDINCLSFGDGWAPEPQECVDVEISVSNFCSDDVTFVDWRGPECGEQERCDFVIVSGETGHILLSDGDNLGEIRLREETIALTVSGMCPAERSTASSGCAVSASDHVRLPFMALFAVFALALARRSNG